MTDRFWTQWQDNAKAYAELIEGMGTPHHREILNPCIEQLMGQVMGCRILDAGCGEGYLSRFYSKKGASVVGVDFSKNLIEIAKHETAGLQVEFKEGDLCNLKDFGGQEFDIVLCNLVLLNLECLTESLREFHRVLRPNGFVVLSIVHPAFNVFGPGRWKLGDKNPQSRRREGQYFVTGDYFLEKEFQAYWKTRAGEEFPQPFSFFHRTISTYVNAIIQTGFRLLEFKEPQPKSDDKFFDRERRVPFFLVIKAEKE